MDNIFSGSRGRSGESEEIFGADQWAFGYSAALQSLDVPPNSQVYCSHASDGLFNLHINTSMINNFFITSSTCMTPMSGQPSQGSLLTTTMALRTAIIENTEGRKRRKTCPEEELHSPKRRT
jgi:hypothetical protein